MQRCYQSLTGEDLAILYELSFIAHCDIFFSKPLQNSLAAILQSSAEIQPIMKRNITFVNFLVNDTIVSNSENSVLHLSLIHI